MLTTWKTDDSSLQLLKGDCRLVLPTLPADSFTACITDPPYHLTTGKKGGSGPASLNVNSPAGRSRVTTGFMGKAWDGGDVAMRPETWAEVLRVLKPGGYLLAFGGTRTFHRITCAIEDAGFEIRDCIMWVYGSGFPKSLDVSKAMDKAAGEQRERIRGVRSGVVKDTYAQDAWSKEFKDSVLSTEPITDAAKLWQGYGTALKPAWEPIIVARKPLAGTVAENCQTHGCGALNIDGCRVPTDEGPVERQDEPTGDKRYTDEGSTDFAATPGKRRGRPLRVKVGTQPVVNCYGDGHNGSRAAGETTQGRWPANVIHDGSDEVLAGFPNSDGNSGGVIRDSGAASVARGAFVPTVRGGYGGGTGSAARFFKCCPQDSVCILCDMPYDKRIETNTGDGSCLKLSSPANTAAISSPTSPATSGHTALGSAAQKQLRQTAHNARCAASLCDSCATAFARALVEIKHLGSSSAELPATQDSTGNSSNSTLIRNLAACAASQGSIDTTPTIPSLTKLFGSVMPAIASFIRPESVAEAAAVNAPAAATRFKYAAKASRSDRGEGNTHPTVKPLALMSYLVKLVTMPGDGNRILDPFAGSGTTLLACYNAFVDCVGIDLEADHIDISLGRVAKEQGKTPLFA